MAGRIAVVDEENRFRRWEERRIIHQHRLVHRSVHVLLFDSMSRLLVQRRHRDKDNYPSHWDVSCAGHVEESDYIAGPNDDLDRVYDAVAARELEEELGVVATLTRVGRSGPVAGVHYEWIHVVLARSDGPFTLQADEVEEMRMLDEEATRKLIAEAELVTPSLRWLVGWVSERQLWPGEG